MLYRDPFNVFVFTSIQRAYVQRGPDIAIISDSLPDTHFCLLIFWDLSPQFLIDPQRAFGAETETGQVVGSLGNPRVNLISTLVLWHGRWLISNQLPVVLSCAP